MANRSPGRILPVFLCSIRAALICKHPSFSFWVRSFISTGAREFWFTDGSKCWSSNTTGQHKQLCQSVQPPRHKQLCKSVQPPSPTLEKMCILTTTHIKWKVKRTWTINQGQEKNILDMSPPLMEKTIWASAAKKRTWTTKKKHMGHVADRKKNIWKP